MKKILSIMLMLVVLSTMVLAVKPVNKTTYTEFYDLDGDGILDEVTIVEASLKETKKTTTLQLSYFAEGYSEYLGQELVVNGEVIVDTFLFN